LFKLKGNYAEGFGGEKPQQKWAKQQEEGGKEPDVPKEAPKEKPVVPKEAPKETPKEKPVVKEAPKETPKPKEETKTSTEEEDFLAILGNVTCIYH
jgi:hypothetical protein